MSPLYALNGFVLMVMWDWFMVPVFRLPELTIWEAIGLAMLAGFLTNQHIPRTKEQEIDMLLFNVQLSDVFRITSNDPDVVARLTRAIARNLIKHSIKRKRP